MWSKKRCNTIGKYNDFYIVKLYHIKMDSKPKRRGNKAIDRGY